MSRAPARLTHAEAGRVRRLDQGPVAEGQRDRSAVIVRAGRLQVTVDDRRGAVRPRRREDPGQPAGQPGVAMAPQGSPSLSPVRVANRWNDLIAASRWATELRACPTVRWARYERRTARPGDRQSAARPASQSRYAPTAVA